ncbi:putative thymidylate kinase protein [Marine Group I thaumarchaeote SCGC AAA799-E16]|uniref:Probable thymidylate kinase n=3 Tax=Marine Group I TaxID=905826 RepID=A0A087RMC2_9ARCH|nr:putative thymidylate kinase protein [Marine Group I thaumarchaeote SCGC AAA799-E16]KFM14626.1 putative thymidylate kinase protein [Marine Group I thaumarchaeote SCGC AAA799-D11]KFM16214.1 putative thymidylate kinase protein [Marine Group I thaumarchaeote SCGC RSA3]
MIIVIEGGDQAGKLTQSTMLEKALKKRKIKTKLFHFPDYKTPIGKEIRKYLDGKRKFPPQVIHCLLSANRWEKLEQIKTAQEKNSVLIMNRYYHSNLVYGLANGMKEKWLESLDAGLPKADIVILLDVSQKESFNRQKTNRDKFEKNEEFLRKISKIYKTTAKKKRWKIIDATKSKQEVHEEIMKTFSKKIGL